MTAVLLAAGVRRGEGADARCRRAACRRAACSSRSASASHELEVLMAAGPWNAFGTRSL